jgi:hypothetical protein
VADWTKTGTIAVPSAVRAFDVIPTKTLFVGLLVGLAHITSGIAVLVNPAALNVTPLALLVSGADLLGYTNGGLAGMLLLTAGVMAVIGSSRGIHATRLTRALLFSPQEFLLVLQIVSISLALVSGKYPDGYEPVGGTWFIAADQSWAWILAVSHSVWLAAFIYGGEGDGRHHR